jgi:hypothetical protein
MQYKFINTEDDDNLSLPSIQDNAMDNPIYNSDAVRIADNKIHGIGYDFIEQDFKVY